jgi:hypothetical protein
MLAAGPAADAVYFVDDHFVPYAGARPVAKGGNTKRRHAQPGRGDTLVVDARGRAVVFASGGPTGLSSNLGGVLAQLRVVLGPDAPILLGFDRGGAYPCVFTTCRDAGADWVSYRRAPLAATTQATITRSGEQVQVMLADETVQIKDYGPSAPMRKPEDQQHAAVNIAFRGPTLSTHVPMIAADTPSMTMAMEKMIPIAVRLVWKWATRAVL